MHPALPALVADGYGHERKELPVVDAGVTVTDDRLVDVVGGDEGQRRRRGAQLGLEPGRVKQPEGDIEVLTEGGNLGEQGNGAAALGLVNRAAAPQDLSRRKGS